MKANMPVSKLGRGLFGLSLLCLSACATEVGDDGVAQTTQEVVSAEPYLYLRCNATGWGVDTATRLVQTSDPYIFELTYQVTQDWMTGGGDQCIVTKTNQANSWGTSQQFYSTRNSQTITTIPGGAPLQLSSSNFTVKYPAKGTYKAKVNWASGSIAFEAATTTTPSTWTKNDKVLVLNFDPVMPESGLAVHEHFGWNGPHALATSYAADMTAASEGAVTYSIAQWIDVDQFPQKADGFSYTPSTYEDCMSDSSLCHSPDQVDYEKVIADYDICSRVQSDEISEVWLFGAPYFGYYESTMAGTGAYWVNSPPVEVACGKKFIIMGFNYERGTESMLHDFGHRMESILGRAFETWTSTTEGNPWWRFSASNLASSGQAGCGNTHFPHNALGDYDYGNTTNVSTNCSAWESYPNLSGATESLSCSAWGCSEYGYMTYLFDKVPRNAGTHGGFENDWWKYLVDYNTYAP